MCIIFCGQHSIYRIIKKVCKLKEYPAHDISLMKHIATVRPLPIAIAVDEDLSILVCTPQTKHQLCDLTILGMIYMSIPHTHIIYIDNHNNTVDNQELDNLIQIPLSLASTLPKKDHITSRPLYFDILITLPHNIQEIPIHYNTHAHTLLHMASRFWESHYLHIIVLSSFLDHHTSHSLLEVIQSFQYITPSYEMSSDMLQWLLDAKKRWRLSVTEFHQLRTLVEGYAQQGYSTLSQEMIEILNVPILKTEDTKKQFNISKQLLLHTLH